MRAQLDAIRSCAEALELHAYPKHAFKKHVNQYATHMTYRLRYDWKRSWNGTEEILYAAEGARSPPAAPNASLRPISSLSRPNRRLTNFNVSQKALSFELTWTDEGNGSHSWGSVLSPSGQKIERPAFTSEQRKIATHFHAKYLLCAEANVVRMRFAKLRGSEQHVVPLEHVEAASGSLKILDDLRVLAKLRERDVELLAKHHNRISHELSRGVLARAPPLEDTDASRTQHKRDVEAA